MKIRKIGICVACVATLLSGCSKKESKTKEDRWDTTETHDIESPFEELPSDKNFKQRAFSTDENDTTIGTHEVTAHIGDLEDFYVNPMRYVISNTEVIFRTATQNAMRGKAIVYTADWRYRTTPQRDENVREYAISLKDKEYVVSEVSTHTGTWIPINGCVVSLPENHAVSYTLNQVVTLSNYSLPNYKSAVYNQNGVRRAFSKCNETYFWSTPTGREYPLAVLFDAKAPSNLVPYPNMPINYIHFSYDDEKNAFTPDYFRTRTQAEATKMNVDDEGFVLVNAASSTVPYTVVLEEGICFSKGDEIYFENVPTYYQDDITLTVGQSSSLNDSVTVISTIYSSVGQKTGANEWTYEVSVVDNRIVSHSVNETVPFGGYVISLKASGSSSAEQTLAPIQEIFKIGAKVGLENSGKNIVVHWDAPDMASFAVKDAVDTTQKYIDLRNKESYDYDADALTKIQEKMNQIYAKMQLLDESKLTNATIQYHYVNMLNAIQAQKDHALLLVSGSHEPVYNQGLWAYPYENTLAELQTKLDWYKASNMNEIIVGPIEDGYATYESKILPKIATYNAYSRDYGKYGKDYLAAVIGEAHKRGIKVQVVVNNWSHWKGVVEKYPEFNDYFALNTRGEVTQDTLDGVSQYLDPANPLVQDLYLSVYEELLSNYDFDGLQLDGIRYGASSDALISSQGITESARVGFNSFLAQKGENRQYNDMNEFKSGLANAAIFKLFNEYRREVVTKFVARCHELSHRYNTILTAAVVAGLSYARNNKLQAWDEWAKMGIIDGIYLMAYYLDSDYVESTVQEAYEACGSATYVVAGIAPVFLAIPNMELSLQLKDVDQYGAVGGTIFANHSYGGRTDVEYYLNGRYGGAFDLESVTTYDKISKTMSTMMNAMLRRSLFIYQENNQQTQEQYNTLIEATKNIKKIAAGKENKETIDKLIAELNKMLENVEQYASSFAVERLKESINYTIHIAKLYYTYYNIF